MSEIKIVNLKTYKTTNNEVLVKVDRSCELGNPFIMKHESQRQEVCEKYQKYFDDIVNNGRRELDKRFLAKLDELTELYLTLEDGETLCLACWCAPLMCHSITIKNYLESLTK